MIELKERRTTRCDRYESDDGHFCNIAWAPIIAAGIGAAGSYLSAKEQNKASDRAVERQIEANKNAGKPVWADEAMPYVFGATGWQPPMPTMSQDAIDYGNLLATGGNATGPIDLDGLLGLIESNDLGGLLGYNQPAPPPIWGQPTSPAGNTPQGPQMPQAPQPPPWWEEQMWGLTGRPGSPLTQREIGRIRHQQQIDAMPPTYSSLGLD